MAWGEGGVSVHTPFHLQLAGVKVEQMRRAVPSLTFSAHVQSRPAGRVPGWAALQGALSGTPVSACVTARPIERAPLRPPHTIPSCDCSGSNLPGPGTSPPPT